MRVTHLTTSAQFGGAESVILECIGVGNGRPAAQTSVVALGRGPFLNAAQQLGASTVVVEPPAAFSALGESFASSVVLLRTLMLAVWTFPTFFRRFSSTVAALLPELIHSHAIKTHVLATLLPPRAPVVWHLHDYLGMRSVSSRLLPLLARRCSLAIAVSESVARDARERLPRSVPVVVVHNAVDCLRFTPDGPVLDLDTLCGLPPAPRETVRIGLPATFARWKGHEVFLQALALIRKPGVRAYVVGGPVYDTDRGQWSLEELRRLASSLGLEDSLGFTGFLSDMPAAYRALDVVVHASTRPEPFGLVIVEAMACGRAVVAAPNGGAAELFVPERHALAAPSDDPEALARTLVRLIDDPALRRRLGTEGRAHVLDTFGRERFASTLKRALSRIESPSAEMRKEIRH